MQAQYTLKDKAYFTFGRFQPFTSAHCKLIEYLESKINDASDSFVALSKTHDTEKNPLSYSTKLELYNKYFNVPIIDHNNRIDDCIKLLTSRGYKHIYMVLGNDRLESFQWIYKYKTELGYDSFTICEFGDRLNDDISATSIRHAISNADYQHAYDMMPDLFSQQDKERIVNEIQLRTLL